MNNNPLIFSFSIVSREASSQLRISISVLSVLIGIYSFLFKFNMIKEYANGSHFDVSCMNYVFVGALVIAVMSVIAGVISVDKRSFLQLIEDLSMENNEKKAQEEIQKMEINRYISLALLVVAIIASVIAILLLLVNLSTIISIVVSIIIGGIVWGIVYCLFKKTSGSA